MKIIKELGFETLPMLSEFVITLEHNEISHFEDDYEHITKYANFITQPLTKGMFIPCDEEGEVLSEPEHFEWWVNLQQMKTPDIECSQYQQAKERVLFADFDECQPVKIGYYLKALDIFLKANEGTIEQFISNGGKLILK